MFSASFTNRILLWWDQVEAASYYTVLMNGTEIYSGDRTNCQVSGLQPDTEYSFRLLAGGSGETIVCRTRKQSRIIPVTDFGAVGDGKALNTRALQSAIDACGEGEEVYIPAGTFLTGALRLHSHMSLHLDKGAVLLGTDNPDDYLPKIPSRFEGTEMLCYQSLLNLGEMDHKGEPNCRDVLIYGEGEIRGGGMPLANNIINREKVLMVDAMNAIKDQMGGLESPDVLPGRTRGRLINLSNCENIHISGLTLKNGPSWNVHILYSRSIVTDHCVFWSEGVWNGDGWDPDSSENCTLFASQFHTGDDAVAIKSGKNPEGNTINRPTRHIRVFDCVSEYGLGIAIGSEMSGGVEDVRIWQCDMENSLYGVQIKATRKRGGYVRDVSICDSVISRFLVTAVNYNDDGVGSDVPPKFENLRCRNTHFSGWARQYWENEDHLCPGVDISGFQEPGCQASNILIQDCFIEDGAGVALSACSGITLQNLCTVPRKERGNMNAWRHNKG